MNSPYLNFAEAGTYTGTSAAYIKKRVYAGELPVIKCGRRSLFARADLDAFMAARRVTGS